MARIEVTGDALVVHVTGVDRILALTTTLTVPLEHITAIEHDPAPLHDDPGLRMRGTRLGNIVTAGSFLNAGDWTFCDVHDADQTVTISLHDEHYNKLVVGVDYPDGVVAEVREALNAGTST